MDEPEPMPAFTFNPDGPTTITYPDGTVSVNAPRPDDTTATTATAPGVSVTATQADNTSNTTFLPDSPGPQPGVTSTVPEPTASEAAVPADAPGINEPPDSGATPADTVASNSVVNPDGSITTRLPDGSTQTVVRLPGGATIVTSTTRPGAYSQPAPPDSPRSRRWRGRSR
jgi:hypothetical protein